ncbi:MAG: hypothetical protein LUG18_16245, partial [Candidatus Azobacteroides sp.]|nr:hypothetical protein [Candidatus Azobacteroides sp.]
MYPHSEKDVTSFPNQKANLAFIKRRGWLIFCNFAENTIRNDRKLLIHKGANPALPEVTFSRITKPLSFGILVCLLLLTKPLPFGEAKGTPLVRLH